MPAGGRIARAEIRGSTTQTAGRPAGTSWRVFLRTNGPPAPVPHATTRRSRNSDMDFAKLDGLIPAVVQDHATREVLMVGFMNQEAWDVTCRTGYVTFYSRTR